MILVNELSSSEHQLVYVMFSMIRNLHARSFYLVFCLFTRFIICFFYREMYLYYGVFFIISEDSSILNTSTLNKVVAKTLELFPNPTKLLVGCTFLEVDWKPS